MICLNLQTVKLFSRILKNIGAWDSIAGELSRLSAGKWRNRFVFAPKCPARLWCPPSFLLNGKSGNIPGRYCGRSMKLATYLHLMPSLRISGPVHLLPLCLQGLQEDKFISFWVMPTEPKFNIFRKNVISPFDETTRHVGNVATTWETKKVEPVAMTGGKMWKIWINTRTC